MEQVSKKVLLQWCRNLREGSTDPLDVLVAMRAMVHGCAAAIPFLEDGSATSLGLHKKMPMLDYTMFMSEFGKMRGTALTEWQTKFVSRGYSEVANLVLQLLGNRPVGPGSHDVLLKALHPNLKVNATYCFLQKNGMRSEDEGYAFALSRLQDYEGHVGGFDTMMYDHAVMQIKDLKTNIRFTKEDAFIDMWRMYEWIRVAMHHVVTRIDVVESLELDVVTLLRTISNCVKTRSKVSDRGKNDQNFAKVIYAGRKLDEALETLAKNITAENIVTVFNLVREQRQCTRDVHAIVKGELSKAEIELSSTQYKSESERRQVLRRVGEYLLWLIEHIGTTVGICVDSSVLFRTAEDDESMPELKTLLDTVINTNAPFMFVERGWDTPKYMASAVEKMKHIWLADDGPTGESGGSRETMSKYPRIRAHIDKMTVRVVHVTDGAPYVQGACMRRILPYCELEDKTKCDAWSKMACSGEVKCLQRAYTGCLPLMDEKCIETNFKKAQADESSCREATCMQTLTEAIRDDTEVDEGGKQVSEADFTAARSYTQKAGCSWDARKEYDTEKTAYFMDCIATRYSVQQCMLKFMKNRGVLAQDDKRFCIGGDLIKNQKTKLAALIEANRNTKKTSLTNFQTSTCNFSRESLPDAHRANIFNEGSHPCDVCWSAAVADCGAFHEKRSKDPKYSAESRKSCLSLWIDKCKEDAKCPNESDDANSVKSCVHEVEGSSFEDTVTRCKTAYKNALDNRTDKKVMLDVNKQMAETDRAMQIAYKGGKAGATTEFDTVWLPAMEQLFKSAVERFNNEDTNVATTVYMTRVDLGKLRKRVSQFISSNLMNTNNADSIRTINDALDSLELRTMHLCSKKLNACIAKGGDDPISCGNDNDTLRSVCNNTIPNAEKMLLLSNAWKGDASTEVAKRWHPIEKTHKQEGIIAMFLQIFKNIDEMSIPMKIEDTGTANRSKQTAVSSKQMYVRQTIVLLSSFLRIPSWVIPENERATSTNDTSTKVTKVKLTSAYRCVLQLMRECPAGITQLVVGSLTNRRMSKHVSMANAITKLPDLVTQLDRISMNAMRYRTFVFLDGDQNSVMLTLLDSLNKRYAQLPCTSNKTDDLDEVDKCAKKTVTPDENVLNDLYSRFQKVLSTIAKNLVQSRASDDDTGSGLSRRAFGKDASVDQLTSEFAYNFIADIIMREDTEMYISQTVLDGLKTHGQRPLMSWRTLVVMRLCITSILPSNQEQALRVFDEYMTPTLTELADVIKRVVNEVATTSNVTEVTGGGASVKTVIGSLAQGYKLLQEKGNELLHLSPDDIEKKGIAQTAYDKVTNLNSFNTSVVNFQDLRIENKRRGVLGSDISTANSLSDASKAIGALTGLYYGLSNNSILGQSNIGKVVGAMGVAWKLKEHNVYASAIGGLATKAYMLKNHVLTANKDSLETTGLERILRLSVAQLQQTNKAVVSEYWPIILFLICKAANDDSVESIAKAAVKFMHDTLLIDESLTHATDGIFTPILRVEDSEGELITTSTLQKELTKDTLQLLMDTNVAERTHDDYNTEPQPTPL